MVRNIRKDGTYPEYGCSFPVELFWFKAICGETVEMAYFKN